MQYSIRLQCIYEIGRVIFFFARSTWFARRCITIMCCVSPSAVLGCATLFRWLHTHDEMKNKCFAYVTRWIIFWEMTFCFSSVCKNTFFNIELVHGIVVFYIWFDLRWIKFVCLAGDRLVKLYMIARSLFIVQLAWSEPGHNETCNSYRLFWFRYFWQEDSFIFYWGN